MGRGEETRQLILAQAVKDASSLGIAGLTIGALAKKLGMSKSGLYAHFGSKEALQVAVIERAVEAFTDAVLRPAMRAQRGEPRVRALLEGWSRWHDEGSQRAGCLLIAATSELDDRPGPARERLLSQQRDLMDFIGSVVGVAQREGHFRKDLLPEQFAFEAYGLLLMHHLSRKLLQRADTEERIRLGIERLIKDAQTPT